MKNSPKQLSNSMISIDGKFYAFDVSKICDFISEKTNKELKETEILDSFDYTDKKLTSKSVRELKSPGNGQENIVYDLLKILIIQIVAFDDEGNTELEDMPFGTKVAFNTLIKEGFLIEING